MSLLDKTIRTNLTFLFLSFLIILILIYKAKEKQVFLLTKICNTHYQSFVNIFL